MDLQTNNMEHLLATLGEARQNGAFAGGAAGYPWQARAAATQSSPKSWQARLWKVGPLAAAAAVAVLFVGPKFASEDGSPIVSDNVAIKDSSGRPETSSSESPSTAAKLKGDYNEDGVVNGLDAQALIEKLNRGEASMEDAAELPGLLANG
ncbi:MAG: hypothetical protein H6819_07720 [Phycisphaerales bacterium]|nr:hypothetical protein [Phycisphaerales bacterium]MCB9854337.1 hypothetical protein [Phycisphaerales bacterium]MCB9863538.1 hypothetical protein [Phycisphaerales bacterium]